MSNYLLFFFSLLLLFSITDGVQLMITNNRKESIWPGILGNAGHQIPRNGGFHLAGGERTVVDLPERWSGRVWARQGCCFDSKTGQGHCLTGDCAGLLHCSGTGDGGGDDIGDAEIGI